MTETAIPGWEGSVGPFPPQHVYARDVHSGAGNCVCGAALGDLRHVQAAPGCPVPGGAREAVCDQLTVYPANVILYGKCETCGQVRWETEFSPAGSCDEKRSVHRGCCAHPHDLPPGGHVLESAT
jgi:hypothetical protein